MSVGGMTMIVHARAMVLYFPWREYGSSTTMLSRYCCTSRNVPVMEIRRSAKEIYLTVLELEKQSCIYYLPVSTANWMKQRVAQ
jgi:hypothetical protein